jgi:pyrimidine operon attenuation protein/uracil phosphoribosyltransferase
MPNRVNIPKEWRAVLADVQFDRALARMSYQILERNEDLKSLAIVGIRTGGEILGKRVVSHIEQISGVKLPFGVIDISLYRDDIANADESPVLQAVELDFPISGTTIVMVDDVLYTGRTVRAALDAIIDFGRPSQVQLAVMVDRGFHEFPIQPDYTGLQLKTEKSDFVRIRMKEQGVARDAVYVCNSRHQ